MNLLTNVTFTNFLGAGPDQYTVLGWIVLLPLIGAVINGLLGKWIGRDGVYITGVATVVASFVLSLVAFYALVQAGAHAAAGVGEHAAAPNVQLSYTAWEWFRAPFGNETTSQLRFRYVLDALSGVMLLVVTGVGSLIHLYSTGYMAHDEGYARYFSFLNLFMFSMLNLILADSIVLLFVGWEGVGLCSYLLIGFWYSNSQYASAGRKAFIVNRIGDVGMILGMTILAWKAGAWDFSTLRAAVGVEGSTVMYELTRRPELNDFLASVLSFGSTGLRDFIYRIVPTFTWGGLALFLMFFGATGKSAQIPLYVWLPDAMAGPTPVSALIHAATMVTAGVYLLCRLSFLYVHFPTVMAVVAVIGAATAFFAATIALVQNELKKVLAYSTVSQLGFMFLGCGVGAFGAGLFHVYTHAMFKACLFLGAGAVMHACRDKQDLRELGGLKKYLPYTFWTFAIGTAAIIGVPGLSGFFSKDEILFRALASHNPGHPWVGKFTFALGVLAATLTAFYMCRLLFMTFWGEFKGWSLEPGKVGAAVHLDTREEAEHEPANVEEAEAHSGHGGHGHGHAHAGNPWDPPHENPWNMTVPLVVLAFMSVVAGYIGLPQLFTHKESLIARWLAPAVTEWHIDHAAARSQEVLAMTLGILAFAAGSGVAYWMYVMQKGEPARRLAASAGPLYRLVHDKWRIDELYGVVFVRPLKALSDVAANVFDVWIIDGIVRLLGLIPRGFGALLRKVQTGVVHTYGAVLALGMLALLAWAVARPSATISYRLDGERVTLQAHGGPGYAYQWDLDGNGQFEGEPSAQTTQSTTCRPVESADGRRVCRIGLRVRNAFGFTSQTVRTIEIPTPESTDRH